jgi:hypothetical protein
MSGTARLALPFISPGQAQKEFLHNEALQRLDLLVAAAVETSPSNDPPPSPTFGACYLVGTAATGDWTGQGGSLAGFTIGGWRFAAPVEGMTTLIKDIGSFATYNTGIWEIGVLRGVSIEVDGAQVVGSRAPAISSPAGGATVDSEARGAVNQILVMLRHHGLIES